MDQQPKYNRTLDYQPESNRAIREVGPNQYAMCGVNNAARRSALDASMPEYTKIKGGNWHSGRSIRVNEIEIKGYTEDGFPGGGVYHRNCMWFDVEIDKEYLDQNAITHVDTILRGNISDNMIHSAIWWPVDVGAPSYDGQNVNIGPDRPTNPEYGDVWVETAEGPPPPPGAIQDDVVLRIWTYTKLIGYSGNPGEPSYEPIYDWEVVFGEEASQGTESGGMYNTTTINNIPTYVFDPDRECRFVVQVHWNQVISNTDIPREMALYVFDGSNDATRALDDYIVKSPIVRMSNKPNPGPPRYDEPTQKGFTPGILNDYYFDPRFKNLSIPITDVEICMDILSGTATVDPNDEYENAVFIDLVGADPSLTISYGQGSEAWVMAPVDDGVYQGNFPYYIGDGEQYFDPDDNEAFRYIPTKQSGTLTLTGAGRYAIYGPGATLPYTAEIAQWLDDNNFPPRDHEPQGYLTQVRLEGSRGLSNITSWTDILRTSGRGMFKNVTGDFNLPDHQSVTDLTEMFMDCPDFTGSNGGLGTWYTDTATNAINTFFNSINFNADISAWNMRNVYSFSNMFHNAQSFNQPLNNWNVGSAVIFTGMFTGAHSFNQPLNNWNTINAEAMNGMFNDAIVYDQDISEWPVPKIPRKPDNWDTNTPDTWIIWEKPWWGIANKPTGPYMVLDWTGQIRVDSCNLTLYRPDKSKWRDVVINSNDGPMSHYFQYYKDYLIFGTATEVSMNGYDFQIEINQDQIDTNQNAGNQGPGDRLYNGYYLEEEHPFQKDLPNYFLETESEFADYAQSLMQPSVPAQIFNNADEFKDFLSNNGWGNNNYNLQNWNQIFLSMGPHAFNGIGRLPDVMPTDIVFADKANVFDRTFQATTNIPGPEITDTWVIPNRTDLTMRYICRWSPDATNADHFIKRILDQTTTTRLDGAFAGVDIGVLDFSDADTSVRVTNLNNIYACALIRGQAGSLLNLDLSNNSSCRGMFAFATTDSPQDNFVKTLRMDTSNVKNMSYMFAHTDVVPDNCSTSGNIWKVNNVVNTLYMFLFSRFPDQIDNWQLTQTGNFKNTYLDEQNRSRYYLDSGDWGMFLGCKGSPSSMSNWDLGNPRRYTYNKASWDEPKDTILSLGANNITGTEGGIILYKGDYQGATNKPQQCWIDNLCPAWFALTPDFNADISNWTRIYWQANPITKTTVVRDYTFAWSKSFNQQIDWYFPQSNWIPIGYVNPDLRGLVYGDDYRYSEPGNRTPGTNFVEAWNPWKKDMQASAFSSISNVFKWWKTFTGSVWNNGGESIPIILADNMCSTFRDSAVDNNITIRKPGSGQGWYSRLFEGTQNWTANKNIDWQMQNRIDDADLENTYYHTIYADRMFKNSTFNGNMGPGWKWFWYNITNVHGYSPMAGGIDEDYIGYQNGQERLDVIQNPQYQFTNINEYNSVYGPNQGPGNIYRHFTGKAAPWGLIPNETADRSTSSDFPWNLQRNSYLGSTTFPVTSWQVFRLGAIRTDTVQYSLINPGHPAETFNLREMFVGSEFDQDLSGYRTRWVPVKGAFTYDEDANWLSEDTYSNFFAYMPQGRPYNVCGQERIARTINGTATNNWYGFGTSLTGKWWNANDKNRYGKDHYGTQPLPYGAPSYGKYYPNVNTGTSQKPVTVSEYAGITFPYANEMTYKQRIYVKQWGLQDSGADRRIDLWIHYLHHPKDFSDQAYLPEDRWPLVLSQGMSKSTISPDPTAGSPYFDWTSTVTLAERITFTWAKRADATTYGGFTLSPSKGLPDYWPQNPMGEGAWPDELGPKI